CRSTIGRIGHGLWYGLASGVTKPCSRPPVFPHTEGGGRSMTERQWTGTDWLARGREELAHLIAQAQAGNPQARREAIRLGRALDSGGLPGLPSVPRRARGRAIPPPPAT